MNNFIRKNLAKIFIIIALSMLLTTNLQAQTNNENLLENLQEELITSNYNYRQLAISRLSKESIELVLLIAENPNEEKEIRKAAIEALKNLISKNIINEESDINKTNKALDVLFLIAENPDEEKEIREAAIRTFQYLPSKKTVKCLQLLLKDPNPQIYESSIFSFSMLVLYKRFAILENIPIFLDLVKDNKAERFQQHIASFLLRLGDKSITIALIDLMKKGKLSISTKLAIIQGLELVSVKEIVPDLLLMLNDKRMDTISREFITTFLGKSNVKEAIPNLIKIFKDVKEPGDLRKSVILALGKMQVKEVIPDLILALKEENQPHVREAIVLALGNMGVKEVIPNLINIFKAEKDTKLHDDIVLILESMTAEVVPFLVSEAFGKGENVVPNKSILELLERLTTSKTEEYFIAQLKNDDLSVRRYAAKTLVQLLTKQNIPTLVKILQEDRDIEIRNKITEALTRQEIHEYKTQSILFNLLKKEDTDLHKYVLEILGGISFYNFSQTPEEKQKTISILIDFLKSQNVEIKYNAEAILTKLITSDDSTNLNILLRDNNLDVRRVFIKILSDLDNKQIIPDLINFLDDRDEKIIKESIVALGKLEAKEATTKLATFATHKNDFIRSAVIEQLGKLEAKETLSVATEMLKDKKEFVRKAAINSLIGLKNKEAENILIKSLNDKELFEDVAVALFSYSNKAIVVEPLINILEKEDQKITQIAIKYLSQLNSKKAIIGLGNKLKGADLNTSKEIVKSLGDNQNNIRIIEELEETESKRLIIINLVNCINFADNSLTENIIDILKQLTDDSKLTAIVAAFKHENRQICEVFEQNFDLSRNLYLSNLATKEEAKKVLLESLRDENQPKPVHKGAIKFLVSLDVKEVIPYLIKALHKALDSNDLSFIISNIKEIGAKEAVSDLIVILKNINDYNPHSDYLKASIVETLSFLYPKEAIPELIKTFDTGNSNFGMFIPILEETASKEANNILIDFVRNRIKQFHEINVCLAIKALAKVKNKEIIPILIELLETSTYQEKKEAIGALKDLKAKEAIPALANILESKNIKGKSMFRFDALTALEEIGDKKAISYLINELSTTNDVLMIGKIINALVKLGGKEAIHPLIKFLQDKSKSTSLHEKIARALEQLEAKEAIPELINTLSYESELVQIAAFNSLKALVRKEDIEILILALKKENDFTRIGVIQLLGILGAKQAVPLLIETLKDKNLEVRNGVVISLGLIDSKQSVTALISVIKDKNEEKQIRVSACYSLAKLIAQEAMPELTSVFLNENEPQELRIVAANSLGEIDLEKTKDLFINALDDKNPKIRRAAAYILGRSGVKEATPELIKIFNDSPKERSNILDSFIKLKAVETLPLLIELLKNKDESIRSQAALALREIKSQEAIPYLIELLKGENVDAICVAAKVLGELKAKEIIPDLIELLNHENNEVISVVATALGDLGAKEATTQLESLLNREIRNRRLSHFYFVNHKEQVYGTVAVALSKLGQKDIETTLIANLEDDSYRNFHSQIIKALGLLKSKKSVPLLILKLKDKNTDNQLRQYIVGALSAIGGKIATDTVINILKEDGDYFVRSIALKGLSDLMGKKSIPILISVLKDKTEFICTEAADALGNLKAKEAIAALTLLLEYDRFYVRDSAKKALKEINKK